MLSVFKIASNINEAVNTGVSGISAFNFIGNETDAMNESNYYMMMESLDATSFVMNADEIITEAAISNPENINILCEATIAEIIAKIKKFFQDAIAFVKGIIAKLVNAIKAMVAKTDAYKKSITKAYEAAAKNGKNTADVKVKAYEWQIDEFTAKGKYISALADGIEDTEDFISDAFDGFVTLNAKNTDTVSADNAKSAIEEIESLEEELSKTFDNKSISEITAKDTDAKLAEEYAEAVNLGTIKTISGIKDAMKKSCCSAEKKEVALGDYKKVLSDIDNAIKGISEIKDIYVKLKDFLTNELTKASKVKADANKAINNIKVEDEKASSELKSKLSSFLQVVYKIDINGVGSMNRLLNCVYTTQKEVMNAYISDKMSMLSMGLRAVKGKKNGDKYPDSNEKEGSYEEMNSFVESSNM